MGSPRSASISTGLQRLDDRDRAYVAELEDGEERATVVSTLLRYRRPDRLHEGERVPSLSLRELESGRLVGLESLFSERPLVLVFGSFT
jgi:hypothetical protein